MFLHILKLGYEFTLIIMLNKLIYILLPDYLEK